MKHRQEFWNLAGVVLLLVAGAACGKTPATNFYTINLPAPSEAGSAPAAWQVGVERPRASHLLRQDRIVYFTSGNELNFYQYHRWAEPPVFLVQSALIRRLQAAGLFDNVVPYRAQKGLDYVVRGRLLAMEEVDSPSGVTARFGLELELVRQKDAVVVWSGRATRERPVATNSVEAVVEAMGGCVGESLDELAGSLRGALARLQAQTGASR
jgi:ABC-type uncharacterized transport system auxiliary subunit